MPYAEQPIGDLRFQQVSLPSGSSSTVNNGSTDVICYQAAPTWILESQAASYGISVEQAEALLYSQAGQSEACLHLDVYVPTGVFAGKSASKGLTPTVLSRIGYLLVRAISSTDTDSAPVLIWIHGGGFTSGYKTSTGDPAGILARSTLNDDEGIVFVSINYRLGMFGWLGGDGLTPNLGLHDQRVSFDWVQKYIHLFGGDPDQVTVMGESAGAASILHHVTSYGGQLTVPFQQAVIQSPAFQSSLNLTQAYDATLAEASNIAGVSITSAPELAALNTSSLQAINFDVVLSATQGFFAYGPAPDGTFVPALPQVLLYEGRFHDEVNILAAHNSLEAAPFVSTDIETVADVLAEVAVAFPKVSNATLTYITNVLYPSSDYASEFLRAVQIASDSQFSCSTRFLATAKGNETYNYLFAYPPGYHGADTSYTFFNGDTSTPVDGYPVNATLAYALQDYIVGFAVSGDPNSNPAGTALAFPIYGSNATVVEFADNGLLTTRDDMDNDRCTWWQRAMVEGLV